MKNVESLVIKLEFLDKTGISGAEYHILGESYYFSEKTSYFWLKNGIDGRKRPISG